MLLNSAYFHKIQFDQIIWPCEIILSIVLLKHVFKKFIARVYDSESHGLHSQLHAGYVSKDVYVEDKFVIKTIVNVSR